MDRLIVADWQIVALQQRVTAIVKVIDIHSIFLSVSLFIIIITTSLLFY